MLYAGHSLHTLKQTCVDLELALHPLSSRLQRPGEALELRYHFTVRDAESGEWR